MKSALAFVSLLTLTTSLMAAQPNVVIFLAEDAGWGDYGNSDNIVTNAFIGMKAMHGSRNVLITGNQFTHNSLWAIGLMPGAAANAENFDGGSIIANNIISDFGHGDAHWIWGDERSPFKFDTGQQADDPPLTNVIVTGNIVHCIDKPRYKYAVVIGGGPNTPRDLHFTSNLFQPGTQGIGNVELAP